MRALLPHSPGAFLLSRHWAAVLLAGVLAASVSQAAEAGPVASATPASPPGWKTDWARGAVFYEVFVRSFQDSDGDGIGDLKGLTSRLDYLKELGVDAIWLMPVFESPSYHGYDTEDYENINPDYGTNADFEAFVREAHARGMRVILDFVINHTSADHPWFIQSASSRSSSKRDWYIWREDDPGWIQPFGDKRTWHKKNGSYFYGVFWEGMPDLNLRNLEVRAEMKRLTRLWLDRGVDGFRLDAARHMIETGPGKEGQNNTPDTHAYWKDFSDYVRSIKPEALLIGEMWDTTPAIAAYYGSTREVRGGDELPMTIDFPLSDAIREAAKTGESVPLAAKLEEIHRIYPAGVLDGTFLTNHDQPRLAALLDNDPAKLRSAAALLLTLPGSPFLYYGEELGIWNTIGGGDVRQRTPMPWDGSPNAGFITNRPWYYITRGSPWAPLAPGHETANVATEKADPDSLLSHYRRLTRLRRDSRAIREGTLKLLTPTVGSSPVLAFTLEAGPDKVLVLHNLGKSPAEVTYPYKVTETLFGKDVGGQKLETGWTGTLPAQSCVVLRIQ
jgi:alpha-amylase